MSERHREAWLARFAMHADATNIEFNKLRAACLRPGAGHLRDLLVVHPQQNCEKPIRAIFFWPQRAGKSGAARCGT
jgi:hypothetical protein